MKYRVWFTIITLFTAILVNAQLSESQLQKIDSLFINWNIPNHPGGVIGIAQSDQILFLKAYGLASLEYLVPNSTGTRFNIASVSKQFTAMGIVKLDLEGKLSVDDDIRKYVPELPDFGETITIRHLLHHTSGLRSLHALLGLAGWRSDDRRTNEDLYRLMQNQRSLNFTPGDEYLYCNTGYMYMAKIIETVTKQEFSEWMKSSIFEPMGMTSTYVENKYNRVVAQNATSYYGSQENGFERAVEYWDYVGSGNIHSTVNDLLKWMSDFSHPKTGWEKHFKKLQTLDSLNNGNKNDYAFGIRIGDYEGITSIGHGGSIGGFRSNVITYPDKELSIVIVTNFSAGSPDQKTNAISEIIFGETENEESTRSTSEIKTIRIPKKVLANYEGSYWSDAEIVVRKIYLRNDTLRYFRSEKNESPIVPVGKDEFQMLNVPDKIIIKFEIIESQKSMITTVNEQEPSTYREFEPIDPAHANLSDYTGDYFSPELETLYSITLQNDTLYTHQSRHGDSPMTMIMKDLFRGEWPFNVVRFRRDKNGNITGISVTNGRVRNLWFEKLLSGVI